MTKYHDMPLPLSRSSYDQKTEYHAVAFCLGAPAPDLVEYWETRSHPLRFIFQHPTIPELNYYTGYLTLPVARQIQTHTSVAFAALPKRLSNHDIFSKIADSVDEDATATYLALTINITTLANNNPNRSTYQLPELQELAKITAQIITNQATAKTSINNT